MNVRFLSCVLFVVLFGCADEISFTKTLKTQDKDLSEKSIQLPQSKDEAPVKPFGTYWKVKSDGEHANGYHIELWKQNEKFYGLISAHSGLVGDPPTGILENVQFDSKTRKFSFEAKLPSGWCNSKTMSLDTFEFKGILTNKKITGNLLIKDNFCSDTYIESKKVINLPRLKEWSKEMIEYQSYAEWKNYADKILVFRGPGW
jgi:hypothetical protein